MAFRALDGTAGSAPRKHVLYDDASTTATFNRPAVTASSAGHHDLRRPAGRRFRGRGVPPVAVVVVRRRVRPQVAEPGLRLLQFHHQVTSRVSSGGCPRKGASVGSNQGAFRKGGPFSMPMPLPRFPDDLSAPFRERGTPSCSRGPIRGFAARQPTVGLPGPVGPEFARELLARYNEYAIFILHAVFRSPTGPTRVPERLKQRSVRADSPARTSLEQEAEMNRTNVLRRNVLLAGTFAFAAFSGAPVWAASVTISDPGCTNFTASGAGGNLTITCTATTPPTISGPPTGCSLSASPSLSRWRWPPRSVLTASCSGGSPPTNYCVEQSPGPRRRQRPLRRSIQFRRQPRLTA